MNTGKEILVLYLTERFKYRDGREMWVTVYRDMYLHVTRWYQLFERTL